MEISKYLFNFLQNHPEPCGIKDLQSRFLYANPAYITMQNLPLSYDISGKLDGEIPAPTCEFESDFQKHDKLVRTSLTQHSSIEIHPFGKDKSIEAWIFHKAPFYDDNSLQGVYFWASRAMNIDSSVLIGIESNSSIILNQPTDLFTEKEWDVLFYLLRSIKIKEIAFLLDVSIVAIRKRLERMYFKVGTSTLKSFIDYCLHQGWNKYIPLKYLQRHRLLE